MNQEELLQLRQKIVDQIKVLAMEGDAQPSDKLQVLMGLIRSGDSSPDVMVKAYEISQQLDGDPLKLDAMLDLIYEIDARLKAEPEQAAAEAETPRYEGDEQSTTE